MVMMADQVCYACVCCALCRNLQRHSEVLLECLPGLWQAAGTSKLQLPLNLPASAAAKLQQTLAGAAGILQRLVSSYCKEVGALVAALSAVGPLREALLAAAEVRSLFIRYNCIVIILCCLHMSDVQCGFYMLDLFIFEKLVSNWCWTVQGGFVGCC
jgi:hypothetical protein